jgi:hypothetical protein
MCDLFYLTWELTVSEYKQQDISLPLAAEYNTAETPVSTSILTQERIECVIVLVLMCKSREFPRILRKNVGSLSAIQTSHQNVFFTSLIYIKMIFFFQELSAVVIYFKTETLKHLKLFVSVLWRVMSIV